jgi:hypothetical protein
MGKVLSFPRAIGARRAAAATTAPDTLASSLSIIIDRQVRIAVILEEFLDNLEQARKSLLCSGARTSGAASRDGLIEMAQEVELQIESARRKLHEVQQMHSLYSR